ncbi:protein spt2 isoform X2 [Impatiens glandulifera]|uniref:protein spt2 isoform X2 n=1 Tax=Impatiens glandulifera TaxID=253017 RepID=UPI001FB08D0E|nr:protein spt2 isoform X2 [Impatiens glandulifera]
MRGYEEYEDLDEYEDEDDEQEDEAVEYEDEVRQPTKEELDYLELRQRLKESIRKQMKKGSGSTSSNSREKNKAATYDNYGSFFGPSQPVIAQRVIQESKSFLESHNQVGNDPKPKIQKSKTASSSNGRPRPPQGSIRPPKLVNQQKMKVETLKHTRDYSFLLSDDAQLPVASREPHPRIPSVPNSAARPANVLPKSRQPSHNGVSRPVSNGDYKNRTPSSMSNRLDPRIGSQKSNSSVKQNQMPTGVRKHAVSSSGSGPSRPMAPKGGSLSSKPPSTSVERKINSAPLTKLHSSSSRQIPAPKQINGGHRKEQVDLGRGKIPVRPTVLSARPQVRPPSNPPPRPSLHDERIKKKPVVKQQPAKRRFEEDDDYEAQNISGLIRGLFKYNPNKYGNDDDDSDMEANYDDIMREERRSAKIAKKEDEEELMKIEEEERRERMRRLKKRKVG